MHAYTEYLRSYWAQLMDNFSISALLATAVTCFLEYTGGDGRAFFIWLAFSMTDCMLGVFRAVLWHQFSQAKLYQWFLKIGTQVVIILLFAMMLDMLRITAGTEITLTNWLVLFFAFFDFSTCIDKLISLRAPIPHFLLRILAMLRHRMAASVGAVIGASDEEVDKLAHSLKPKKTRAPKGVRP